MSIVRKLYNKILKRNLLSEEQISKILIDKIRVGGGTVGENVDILSSNIDMGEPYLLSIGSNVTITGVRILTHDASTYKELGYTKVGRVTIGDNVFVGFGSIILPDTKIGNKVIIGAGSVVAKDIPDNSVAAGSPCKVICTYDEYMQKIKNRMAEQPCFDLLPEELMLDQHKTERDELIKHSKGFIK